MSGSLCYVSYRFVKAPLLGVLSLLIDPLLLVGLYLFLFLFLLLLFLFSLDSLLSKLFLKFSVAALGEPVIEFPLVAFRSLLFILYLLFLRFLFLGFSVASPVTGSKVD